MIVMLSIFNTVLTCYDVKIIIFTRWRTKRHRGENKSQQISK